MESIVHQAGLFDDASRWPRRPYCTDDLASGLRIRSLKQAMLQPYIQANPPHLRVWSIHDVDRPGAALAWEAAGLPPPTWAAVNRVSAHAHLVWGLSAPVLVDGLHARDAPMRYLCAVESLMRERMQADEGFSGLITKNPEHPLWRTYRGPTPAYDLAYLAEHLPDIERHRPRRGTDPARIGLGRNCSLFDALKSWAYVEVRKYRDAKGLAAWNEFMSTVQVRALMFNCNLFGSRALDHREVHHVAKSVGKWTWRDGRLAVAASDKRFSNLQSFRASKREKAQHFNEQEPEIMAAKHQVKRSVSARELAERFKVSERGVRNVIAQPRDAWLTENSISREQPWKAMGISRRTWYRRGKPLPPADAQQG